MSIGNNEQPPESERVLLTVNDCCRRLQLSRPTVYELINSGELRSICFGRARRIPARALEEFVARRLDAAG
jgi:excisionase family DNA binding protein